MRQESKNIWGKVGLFKKKKIRDAFLRIFTRSKSGDRDLPPDAERRDETTEPATKFRGNGRSARTR